MKKIMFAAVCAASIAALADCTITPVHQAAVYAWKFTGRTTQGVPVTQVSGGSSACVLPNNSAPQACYIRVPAALAIQGYTYICDNCCESFKDGTGGWTLSQFYITKPHQSGLNTTINFDVAHIIGTTKAQYEVLGKATFTTTLAGLSEQYALTFAGLGTWSRQLDGPVAISGNFAGSLTSPYYVNLQKHICAPADYWNCALVLAGHPEEASVAYGVWSARYNAAASANYRKGGYTAQLPAWAR